MQVKVKQIQTQAKAKAKLKEMSSRGRQQLWWRPQLPSSLKIDQYSRSKTQSARHKKEA